jgi:GR25 family glycosyltransferase involved in LPS biosynthesis
MDLVWLLAQTTQLEAFHDEREPKVDNPAVKTLRWNGRADMKQVYDFVVSKDESIVGYHLIASENCKFLHSREKISLSILNKIFDSLSEWNRCLILDDAIPLKKWCTTKLHDDFSVVITKNSSSHRIPKNFSHEYKFSDCTLFLRMKLGEWMTQATRTKNIDVKIISLDFDCDRRFMLKNSLKNFHSEIFYGFDAAKVHYRECPKILGETLRSNNVWFATTPEGKNFIIPSSIRINRKPLSRGEFGCAMSHLLLYQEMTKPTIIFEDDASIDDMNMFMHHVQNLPPYELWDICYLQSEATWWPPLQTESINEWFSFSKGSCNRTHAYMLTPTGAQKLLAFNRNFKSQIGADDLDAEVVALPSDDLISHAQRAGILRGICPKIRCIGTSGDCSRIASLGEPGKLTISMNGFGDKWTGIGNQMWQYAALKVLECKTRGILSLGESKLGEFFPQLKIQKFDGFVDATEIKEFHEFTAIPEIIKPHGLNGNVRVEGYLQNIDYLKGWEDLTREIFSFPKDVVEEGRIFIETIKRKSSCPVVGVHIRLKDFRGDTSEFLYNIWKPDVLRKILRDDRTYIIFSNDIPECKRIFGKIFSDKNHEWFSGSAVADMCMMSICRELIISASSFSWWAAFLGGCRTIIPTPWFNPRRLELQGKDVSGLYLEGWDVVQN